MNKFEIKNKCNDYYDKVIIGIERNKDITEVHKNLIECVSLLVELSNIDTAIRLECQIKARKLLNLAKSLNSKSDYENIYFELTGKKLNILNDKLEDVSDNFSIESNEEVSSLKNQELQDNKKNAVSNKAKKIESNSDKNKVYYTFNWDEHPTISFDDVAGLESVKDTVKAKVLLPLQKPELFEGYTKKNGGGILLYGPPGTGKTMIAAAIAHEINAKFCSIGPSDLLTTGVGNSEKLIAKLFDEARSFKCSVIFFDEFESLCPISTHAQHARQIRSELLKQMQGLDSYGKESNNILLLIGATNKPWDIDPAFVRPGRLGTRIYVDLPDAEAREYMLNRFINKIKMQDKVYLEDIDLTEIVAATDGFNGADMTNLIDKVQEISIKRVIETNEKKILQEDFISALNEVTTSVQKADIEKLIEWNSNNQ